MENGYYSVQFYDLSGNICHTEVYDVSQADFECRYSEEFSVVSINVQRRESPTTFYYQFFNAKSGDLSKLYDEYDRYVIGRNFEKNLIVTIEQATFGESSLNGKIVIENIFPPYNDPRTFYLNVEQDYNNPSLDINDGIHFLSFENDGIHINYTTIDRVASTVEQVKLVECSTTIPYF